MKVNCMEKIMRLEFERDTDHETKHKFHRYYQVIKYEGGDRYIPTYNEFTRKHTACIYREFKDIKGWVFWCSDNGGSNKTFCDSMSIAKQQAKIWVRG